MIRRGHLVSISAAVEAERLRQVRRERRRRIVRTVVVESAWFMLAIMVGIAAGVAVGYTAALALGVL